MAVDWESSLPEHDTHEKYINRTTASTAPHAITSICLIFFSLDIKPDSLPIRHDRLLADAEVVRNQLDDFTLMYMLGVVRHAEIGKI